LLRHPCVGLRAAAVASWTVRDADPLRGITELPILVKGILRPDDAQLSLDHGATGVIVSNHGGRQLDTVPASIEAIPAIAEALQGRGELLMDGGVRRGTDIIPSAVNRCGHNQRDAKERVVLYDGQVRCRTKVPWPARECVIVARERNSRLVAPRWPRNVSLSIPTKKPYASH
jgi:hypothetical protein